MGSPFHNLPVVENKKVIGIVGPIETGDAKLYVDGFVAGVKATDPTIEVNVNYIGSFSDVALAAELLAGSPVMVSCVLSFPHGADATPVKAFQAKQAIADAIGQIHRYSNTDHLPLREAIAEVHGLDPARIISFGFGLGLDESHRDGILWVDDVELLTGLPEPAAPTETAAAEPAAEAAPAEEAAAAYDRSVAADSTYVYGLKMAALARVLEKILQPRDRYRGVVLTTGEVLATLTQATDQDLDAAVAAARKAQPSWAALPGLHGRQRPGRPFRGRLWPWTAAGDGIPLLLFLGRSGIQRRLVGLAFPRFGAHAADL